MVNIKSLNLSKVYCIWLFIFTQVYDRTERFDENGNIERLHRFYVSMGSDGRLVNVIYRQAARYRSAALHGNDWKIKCIFFLS